MHLYRPTYLFTWFFVFQALVLALCWFFQLEGAPDDLWLIALAHIPVVMVTAVLEGAAAMADTHIRRPFLKEDSGYYIPPHQL